MNKLLILTSFLFIFSMKINAYQYEISNASNGQIVRFYQDKNGKLYLNQVINGNQNLSNSSNDFWSTLDWIGRHNTYISKTKFASYYTNDLIFLNDLYNQATQQFLNYLYNPNRFSSSNHINYENYQILYNSDGLAVESIVNGVWRGLYSSSDKSGYLYDKKGNLAYIDGVEPSFFEKLSNKFLKPFKFNLESIFIKKIWYSLLVFIFAVVILRTVIRMAFKAFLIRFYDNKIQRLERQREKIENA